MSVTSDFVKKMKKGEFLSDKRVLAAMKRKGLIHGYSEWGDLERVPVSYNGGTIHYEIFPFGNADEAVGFIGATKEEVLEKFGKNRMITYEGVKFTTSSKSGCFYPCLVKLF